MPPNISHELTLMKRRLDKFLLDPEGLLLSGVGPYRHVKTSSYQTDGTQDGKGNHELVELLLDDVHEIGTGVDEKTEVGKFIQTVGQENEPSGHCTSRNGRHDKSKGHETFFLGGAVRQQGEEGYLGGGIGAPRNSLPTVTAILVGVIADIVAPTEEALLQPVVPPASGSHAVLLDLRLTNSGTSRDGCAGRHRYRAVLLPGIDGTGGDGDDGPRAGGGINLIQADAPVDGGVGMVGERLGHGGVAPVGLCCYSVGGGDITGRHGCCWIDFCALLNGRPE